MMCSSFLSLILITQVDLRNNKISKQIQDLIMKRSKTISRYKFQSIQKEKGNQVDISEVIL